MTFDEWWEENWKRIVNSDIKQKDLLREAFESGYSGNGTQMLDERDHYKKEGIRLSKKLKSLCDVQGRQYNTHLPDIEVV